MPRPTLDFAYGSVALMANAPHPNAAKVYINWLLSTAGQTEWGKIGGNSRRIDIPWAVPALAPKPGVTYIPEQTEENLANRQEAGKLAKQYIPVGP